MPPFWRSLLGGSSSSSSSSSNSASQSSGSAPSASASTSTGSTSASSSRSSQLRKSSSSSLTSAPTPAGSSSSSLTAAPLKGGGGSSSTATSNGSGKHKSSSGSRSSQSSLAAGNAPHSSPIGIPNAGPAPGSSGQQQHQPPYQQPASLAGTSVTSGGLSSSVGGGELTDDPEANTDDGSIPETPFSTGHSPSHARHKFPQEEAGASATAAATSPSAHRSVNGAESDSSPPNAVASPSGGSLGLNSNSSQAPDIPTTHTILANPLPQPSSGLAAAISSVLPSSSSSNSAIGPSAVSPANGKASSSNADPAAPRTFDIDDMITRLLDVGYSAKITKSVCLKNSEITALCLAAREVFLSQPTLLELAAPVKVIGDIHGQYHDLIRLFEMSGYPPQANYLFLGDYVDRGKQSLETILLLLCYKVKYPENFFMLRGNHECANVTRVYGFYDECKRRCNIKVWKTFVDVFNCLPIASIVGGKIFCVHGGLSPSLSTMDDIRRISRPTDVPDYGLLNDLLWSDPSDTALDWEDNERGVSYCFGKAVINEFLRKYDFDLICRAHMVVEDGYEFWNERTLVTIFSAPNYCGEFDNYGAGLSCSSDLLCTFELLRPLEGPALRKELVKAQKNRSARGRG